MKKLLLFTFTLFFVSLVNLSFGQLPGWSDALVLDIQFSPEEASSDHAIIVTVNTEDLISAGKMQAGGEDIRFATDCDGGTLYDYWIHSGINTPETKIFVTGFTPEDVVNGLYMIYGNPDADAGQDFDAVFPNQRIFSASEELLAIDTLIEADYIEVGAAEITLGSGHPGKVRFKADYIKVDGIIDVTAKGFAGSAPNVDGEGPGGGAATNTSFGAGGGGAGYGGNGGTASAGSAGNGGGGGQKYGQAVGKDIQRGSGGGGGDQNVGGAGGGAVILEGIGIDVIGSILAEGEAGGGISAGGGGGGGSGGGILIMGQEVNLTGTLLIKGGDGGPAGNWPGGGGAGGRLKIFYETHIINDANINSNGGFVSDAFDDTDPQAEEGKPGTVHVGLRYKANTSVRISTTAVDIQASDNMICSGDEVEFIGSGSFDSFDFILNGETVQSGTESSYKTTSLPDSAEVLVENYNAAGGCRLRSKVEFIRMHFNKPTAKFSAEFDKLEAEFTDKSLAPVTWEWDFGDGTFSNIQHPTHEFPDVDTYRVHLTVTNGCGLDTFSRSYRVSVLPNPIADFEYFNGVDSTYFTDLTQNEVLTWSWSFGDGDSAFVQNPAHKYEELGTYEVCLIALNVFGSDTVCKQVVIDGKPPTSINNNGEALNRVLAYPNPVKNQLTLDFEKLPNNVRILDIKGRLVKEFIPAHVLETIPMEGLTPGVYLIESLYSQGRSFVRIIKE